MFSDIRISIGSEIVQKESRGVCGISIAVDQKISGRVLRNSQTMAAKSLLNLFCCGTDNISLARSQLCVIICYEIFCTEQKYGILFLVVDDILFCLYSLHLQIILYLIFGTITVGTVTEARCD